MSLRVGFLISHPIQYYAPIFRAIVDLCDLTVFFAHRQTAEQQARAGFDVAFEWDVDLLSGYRSKFLANVSRRPSTERYGGCDTPGVAGEIAEGRFDGFVVPGWALRSYLQAARACRKLNTPVLVRGDSQLRSRRGNALVRVARDAVLPHLLRRFDGFLYVGQRNREYLLHYGTPTDRLFFSPHCVDNDAFRAAAENARRSSAGPLGGARNGKRILFAGKLIERKRPLDVLRAAATLNGRGIAVEVIFAGSGELEGLLRRSASDLGVRADFLGFVNQSRMPAVYAGADVVVLPSDGQETWGLVINEAMACGIPVVVSDAVGCGPDLVETGATGATFPLGNITLFADAIETATSLHSERVKMHLAARLEVYSPQRAAQGIIQGVTALAAQARSPKDKR